MERDARHPPPPWRYEVVVTRGEAGACVVRVQGGPFGASREFPTLLRAFEYIERDVGGEFGGRGVR